MSKVKEILVFNAIPKFEEVLAFIDCYDGLASKFSGQNQKTRYSEENFGYFCAATWICNRNLVLHYEFLEQLFKIHNEMNPGKIVKPHQLSTAFAEENCNQIAAQKYARTPEGRAVHDALANKGVSLEKDKKYEESGYRLEKNPYDVYSLVYCRERQIDIDGHIADWLVQNLEEMNLLDEFSRSSLPVFEEEL